MHRYFLPFALALLLLAPSCEKDEDDDDQQQEAAEQAPPKGRLVFYRCDTSGSLGYDLRIIVDGPNSYHTDQTYDGDNSIGTNDCGGVCDENYHSSPPNHDPGTYTITTMNLTDSLERTKTVEVLENECTSVYIAY